MKRNLVQYILPALRGYAACAGCSYAPFVLWPEGLHANLCHLQDYRFGGAKFDGCSNIDFHGPYEQTYVDMELPYTQGKILAIDDSSNPGTMTVQASCQAWWSCMMTHIARFPWTSDAHKSAFEKPKPYVETSCKVVYCMPRCGLSTLPEYNPDTWLSPTAYKAACFPHITTTTIYLITTTKVCSPKRLQQF